MSFWIKLESAPARVTCGKSSISKVWNKRSWASSSLVVFYRPKCLIHDSLASPSDWPSFVQGYSRPNNYQFGFAFVEIIFTLTNYKFKCQSDLTGFLGILTFLAISSQTQSFNSELPKVSYIKAIDVWMFVCNLFVFLSLMEYAFAQVIIQFKFDFGSIKYL